MRLFLEKVIAGGVSRTSLADLDIAFDSIPPEHIVIFPEGIRYAPRPIDHMHLKSEQKDYVIILINILFNYKTSDRILRYRLIQWCHIGFLKIIQAQWRVKEEVQSWLSKWLVKQGWHFINALIISPRSQRMRKRVRASNQNAECERATGWGEKLNVDAALRFLLEETMMGYFIPSWGSPQDAWGTRHAVNETRARMRANYTIVQVWD